MRISCCILGGWLWFGMLSRDSAAEGLRDGSGKPGEGLCVALCRTWNGQPGLKMRDEGKMRAPNYV